MSTLKKSLIISFILIFVAALVFAYNNWTIWQYQYGNQPVVINYLNSSAQELPQGNTYVLDNNAARRIHPGAKNRLD